MCKVHKLTPILDIRVGKLLQAWEIRGRLTFQRNSIQVGKVGINEFLFIVYLYFGYGGIFCNLWDIDVQSFCTLGTNFDYLL